MSIAIFFSPQPDEQHETSAAYEYAKRASDKLSCKDHFSSNNINIQRLLVDSLNSLIGPNVSTDETLPLPLSTLIIVSCSADGSVDRNVRKIVRSLKSDKKQSTNKVQELSSPSAANPTRRNIIAIALLGHARCDNSANQTKETIFNYGRKFHQFIEASTSSRIRVVDRLEVQVEIEGPEAPGGFDEWVNSMFSF